MGNGGQTASPKVHPEESIFLMSVVRRFPGGVTEGHLQTVIFAGQRLRLIPARYEFLFQELVPFCEELDFRIAKLVWSGGVFIHDNRLRAGPHPGGWDAIRAAAESKRLDKLIELSYDSLKFLAAALHLEQDLQKSRPEAVQTARRFFSVQAAAFDYERWLEEKCPQKF